MRIGIDLHDTITYRPKVFQELISQLIVKSTIYIVSGTPEQERNDVVQILDELSIPYTEIILGFNYKKEEMTTEHFLKMREWKLQACLSNEIDLYIDDNPFYVKYCADNGVCTLQTILSSKYIESFLDKDPYFTSHLQSNQFEYLKDLSLTRRKYE